NDGRPGEILMKARASCRRVPQVGVGGWTANPRNESADSVRMAAATPKVAFTVIGPMALGIMCQKMMRESRAPEARAASTNSFSFSDRNTPRTIRASGIQKNSERIRTVWKRLPPGTNVSMKGEPSSENGNDAWRG